MTCKEHGSIETRLQNFDEKLDRIEKMFEKRFFRVEAVLFMLVIAVFLFAGAVMGTEEVAKAVAKNLP